MICATHPKANPGTRRLLLSLNSVDFGRSPLEFKFYRQLAQVTMRPTGGLLAGGSRITFSGSGFDAFYGQLDDTLCRWGDANDDPVFAPPLRMDEGELVCASVPQAVEGDVPVSIALNRVDFGNSTLFRYYSNPSFAAVAPTRG